MHNPPLRLRYVAGALLAVFMFTFLLLQNPDLDDRVSVVVVILFTLSGLGLCGCWLRFMDR